MNFSAFVSSLAYRLTASLEKAGFRKYADDLFVRFNDSHEISVISIQKHSADSKVSVNFGVHYDFLPKVGTSELPSNGEIELPDCEVKVRLTPDPSKNDHWWPLDSEAVNEVAWLIEHRVNEFFDRYNLDGYICSIVPENLEENIPDIIAMLTKVRASLMLARIHLARGDMTKAANFAQFGIKEAGMAVGPKKLLKDILKQIDQVY